MGWFKSHHGFANDPTWWAIARDCGVSVPEVMALVWNLLDSASQHRNRGSILGFDAVGFEAQTGIEAGKADEIIVWLRDAGLIVDDRWADWDEQQAQLSMSGSAIRMRRKRQRDREAGGGGVTSDTGDVTVTPSDVTPVTRDVTPAPDSREEILRPSPLTPLRVTAEAESQDLKKSDGVLSAADAAPGSPGIQDATARKRERWLDGVLKEAQATMPSARYGEFVLAILADPWPPPVKAEVERLSRQIARRRGGNGRAAPKPDRQKSILLPSNGGKAVPAQAEKPEPARRAAG